MQSQNLKWLGKVFRGLGILVAVVVLYFAARAFIYPTRYSSSVIVIFLPLMLIFNFLSDVLRGKISIKSPLGIFMIALISLTIVLALLTLAKGGIRF